MFRLFGKKERGSFIVSPVNGTAIDISMVNDPVFSQKMMGDGIAFELKEEKAVICAPADGVLSVLFPTGHAFGVTADNGAELLVHIGINTVESGGKGFRVLSRAQGDNVKAGDPVVEVDVKALKENYDMTTMLIVTNPNGQEIVFRKYGSVKKGDYLI